MSKRVSTYLTDRTLDVVAGDGLSGRINRMADRYGEILRRTRIEARFTADEMNALRDVCNGWLAEPAAVIDCGVALELEDSIPDGIGDKWGIEPQMLLNKLAALNYCEEVALVEAIEAYWRGIADAGPDGPEDEEN